MFIDSVKIKVKAGDGGRGCHSIYRDMYTRQGIPNGGDGGKGADIILQADRNVYTLLDFKYKAEFRGDHGQHGSGKDQKGKNAKDVIIKVPVGTLVKDVLNQCVLRDLDSDGDSLILARGGKGGLGNMHKCEAKPGLPGEEREAVLDLKLIADVGIVGFPNSGKSTLVSAVSGARPKVAPYPFTTKEPSLGVVKTDDLNFVVADIPGLIEGSHDGRGLGIKFLRHVERTKILVHLIDMAGVDGREPAEDYKIINRELQLYDKTLGKRFQVIAANKMDLPQSKENLKKFRAKIKKKIYLVSASNKIGLEELIGAIVKGLQTHSH
jgi:GTP-binding protein